MGNNLSDHNLSKVQSNIERGNIYLDSYPYQVHFLMIDKCNVKCIMCGGDYFKSKSGRMITLEKFKTMAANLKLENARAIVLAGAGDPLLNRDLVRIIEFVRNTYPHINISVTTNGLALTPRLSALLQDNGVGQVNISINSATRVSYRRIMQVDGFDAVCRNARSFVEQRNRSGRPTTLQFSAAINRLNIEDLPRLVELAREIGVNSINLFYTRYYPERIRHLNIEDPADRLENDTSLFFHQQLSDEMVLKAKALALQYRIHMTHEPLFRDHAPACKCTWPMTQVMAGFDGEIYPCGGSEVHFREKVEKGIYDFGNALQAPVDAFWNSEIYRHLRISSRQESTCLIRECNCCANTISPNDIRSHIMQWDENEAGDGLQPAETARGPEAARAIANPPLVSVIVPTYNRPGQLGGTLKSILAQTYRNVEIIVVNDCGIDVEQTITSLNQNRSITYVRHGMNRGLAAARNTGIKVARGKYIAYLDDDDLFYPRHVETLVRALETGEHKVAYTDAYRAHQEKRYGEYVVTKRDVPYSFDFDYDRILTTNFIPVLCFMHERSCVAETGLFDESLKRLEDWDMWIRMSRKFKFAHIKELTCEFSWRTDGTTMSSGQMEEFVEARKRIAAKYHDAPPSSTPRPRYTEQAKDSVVSMVILTFNQLEYTKECVESIRKHTPEPHEIIFVDNGSKDGTVQWLQKLVQEHGHYELIENETNLGFAKGCNQGIEAASGEYVLLLNNDTVVTKDWLSGMLETLNSAPDIGIVGPMTNHISGVQKVERVGYDAIDGLESYARTFREKNRHRRIEARRVVGFCMLFRRSLVDQIGLLDESFGTGNFEDDDFCARAALAGYLNLIAGDVFIHHFGSRSFIGNRIDYGSAMTGNRRIYADKWRAIEQKPEEGKKIRALVARERGLDRVQRGDMKGAADLYLAAIRQDPQDSRPYQDLAEILIQVGRHRDALETLQQSPLAAGDPDRMVLEGYCREGLKDPEAAQELAAQALAINHRCASALNLRGVLAFKQGKAEEAKSLFRKAAEGDPSWGEPCTNLGVLTWAEGQQAEAFELLERGFVLTPCQTDLAERYHAAAVSLGALARAEAVFREARGLYPSNRTITFLRIDLLMAQENFLSAMPEIESAMAAFDVDDGLIAAALAVRGKIGPLEIQKRGGGETLSLCMIVKNEQSNLVRSLSSVRAVVDEIIVVDTGSTDRTKDIAAVFGAKVFDAPWTDDFAEARNTALSKATGDWIFVLDADEAVSPADCLKLKGLLKHAASRKGTAGWLVTTRNYSPDMNLEGWTANDGSYGSEEKASGWFPSVKVRLFRNDPRIRYEGAVHEMVEPSMKREGLAWRSCDVIVHHYGYVNGGGGSSKGESYYKLGGKKIEQTGGDPRSVFELAVQASGLKKYGEAVALWHRYLASGCKEDRHLAFLNLGHVFIETGRYSEARAASMAALSIDPGLKEAGLNTALCEFYTGRYREAVSRLEGLVAATSDYPPAFVLLSAARLLSGEQGSAEAMVQTLRKRNINGAPFYQVYGQKLHEAGRNEDAETILEAARKSWSAMLESLGLPATAENIGALMAAVPLDDAGKTEAPPETAIHVTRSDSGRPCLSLCMIVKNEERTIARALGSVKALADEMIVVDTGSTDRTKEIAAALGAKVFEFPWTEDFSSARNFSLSRATGDWILVIDADETVSSRDHETIRDFIKKSPAGTGGYYLTTRNYVVEANTAGWVANDGSYRDEEAGTGWYPNRKVRLFRNDPRIRFSGAVHELVEAAMQNAGMRLAECSVPIHHTGKLDRANVLEKGQRYYLLGLKKIEETGGTPRAILELAIQAGELGRYDDAIRLWKRFLDGKPAQGVKQAYVNLINACLNSDRFDEALLEARKVAGQANGTRELLLNCAAAEFFAGDLRKATRMAEKILKKDPDYPPALGLLAMSFALAGHEERSMGSLQRLREKGLEPRSQILPVIEKLQKMGKKDEADRLLSLLDGQPRAACGPTPPSPDRSRQESSSVSVQR